MYEAGYATGQLAVLACCLVGVLAVVGGTIWAVIAYSRRQQVRPPPPPPYYSPPAYPSPPASPAPPPAPPVYPPPPHDQG